MRTESATPKSQRFLMLDCKLPPSEFEKTKKYAIEWSRENGERINTSNLEALRRLSEFTYHSGVVVFLTRYCYADIPENKKFNLCFERGVNGSNSIKAQLLFGIFQNRLPTLGLDHGHHQIAAFSFSGEILRIIKSIPSFPNHIGENFIALCDSEHWKFIAEESIDAAT